MLGDTRILHLFRTKDSSKNYRYYGKQSKRCRLFFTDYLNILGPVINAELAAPDKPKKEKVSEKWLVERTWPTPALGIRRGDSLIVNPNGEAPLGKLIGVKDPESGAVWFARVCLNDERGIFVYFKNEDGEDERGWLSEYEHSAFGPVVEVKRASKVNAEKIAKLKERLEKIRRNDWDSICDTSRQFELERELYTLENPVGEQQTADAWPEVIGEGSATHAPE